MLTTAPKLKQNPVVLFFIDECWSITLLVVAAF